MNGFHVIAAHTCEAQGILSCILNPWTPMWNCTQARKRKKKNHLLFMIYHELWFTTDCRALTVESIRLNCFGRKTQNTKSTSIIRVRASGHRPSRWREPCQWDLIEVGMGLLDVASW